MATTPEGKIKRKLKNMLVRLGVWHFFPSAGPMGKSGIPDVICIVNGLFVGIECKADEKKQPSALQDKIGEQIKQAGGHWYLCRSQNDIDYLENIMSEIQKRISYQLNFDGPSVVAKYDETSMEFPLVEDDDTVQALALYGMRAFLQARSINASNKTAAITEAYDELCEDGMSVFERKSPVGRKVQFKKADKIMALAMLKNTTLTAINEVLGKMEPEKVKAVLNSPAVMEKLKQMQEEVDLG